MDPLEDFDFDAVHDDPDIYDYKGNRPSEHTRLLETLERASAENDVAVVAEAFETLRRTQASPRLLSRPGSSLQIAINHGHEEVVKCLLSNGVEIFDSHIRSATKSRARPIIQLLLQYGWPINAALGWSDPPALAYAVEDLDLSTWFLVQGADPNASCQLDVTPLSAAVQYGRFDVIRTLFANGGAVNRGQLLHFAIWRSESDRLEVVKYILQKGAPIDTLMYHNHPSSFKHFEEWYTLGTPLHDAADIGDVEVVQTLLAHGASVLGKDTSGRLPFERAEAKNHDMVARLLRPSAYGPRVAAAL